MAAKKKRELEWAKAKRLCRLNRETVRMAKELGMNPRKLIKNIPSKSQPWKAPMHIWIRDMYEDRMERAARKKADKQTQQDADPNAANEKAIDDLPPDRPYAEPPFEHLDSFNDVAIFTDEKAFFEDVRETMEFLRPSRCRPELYPSQDQ